MRIKLVVTAIVGALFVAALATPADAQRYGRGHHHRGGGGGGAFIGGLAAGAILGGALASQPRYGYGYGPGYAPGYVADDAVEYCLSRFKSYDPASGTYLGYDGLRHPCP